MNSSPSKQGVALITVLCLTALAMTVGTLLATLVGGAALRTRDSLHDEQAFFVAESAIELGVQYIADGGAVPATNTGTVANGTYVVRIESTPVGAETRYTLTARGTVGNRSRVIGIQGLRPMRWSRFALWYDKEAMDLWIAGGEKFQGPVHANTRMRFHSYNVASLGQARFYDTVSTTAASYDLESPSVSPIFDYGISLNAATQTTTTINFGLLRTNSNLVLDGTTSIKLTRTNMVISNARAGWTNRLVSYTTDGSIYVRTVTTGLTNSRAGDLLLSGTNGLSGRLTLIADRDIIITNHVRYYNNPITNASSDDALGLVAQRHVLIQTNAPNNLYVFAHIIAATGGFGVVNYDSTALGQRGNLTVYGGIVNKIRQPVGTTGGTGYTKNYIYDSRFQTRPPPNYPILAFAYQWSSWDDRATY